MSANLCVRCAKPMADTAYACTRCAHSLAETLVAAAGHAEDAWTVIARQTRYGAGSGGRSGGGSYEPDLTAAARLTPITLAICGWARIVSEETGRRPRWRPLAGPLCPPTGIRCEHGSCEGIRRRLPPSDIARDAAWLAGHVGWLRKHPAAGEAFKELRDACEDLARLVDRPADKELVGMCDCGRTLYAPHGKAVVQCPERTCQLTWNVAQSRGILRDALAEKLFTAAEAAHLAAYWDERTSEQIRKLINSWSSRTRLTARGWIAGDTGEDTARRPTYRFGDILDLLEAAPRRTREGAAA